MAMAAAAAATAIGGRKMLQRIGPGWVPELLAHRSPAGSCTCNNL